MKKKFISSILVMVMITSFLSILPVNAENGSSKSNTQVKTDISVQGTNSFGNLMTNELTAEMDRQEENNGCNIFSIEMNEKEATVSFETTESCILIVAVYSEYDGNSEKMLASGSTTVAKGETETLVTIDADSMPQYYYLRGFLVDSDTLRPLCTAYESPNYTQEMQEFFSKTVNDFDSKKVLNLDNDEYNNFAVFSDETIIVEQSGAVNRVIRADDNTLTYVIVNADSTVKSLQNGDIFTCKNGDETLIVKVDKISVNGSSVTVKGQDTSMEDVFDYVKIDESQDIGQATVDTSNLPKGVIYNGINNSPVQQSLPSLNRPLVRAAEGEWTSGKSHSFSFESPNAGSGNSSLNISGSLSLENDVKLKYYISLHHQYLELKFDYKAKISIEAKASVKKCDIKLAEFNYPIAPGINIGVIPRFVVEISGKIELSGMLTGTVGFRVSNDEGIRNISSLPHFEAELKAEVTVFVGLLIEPNINIINSKFSKVGMEARIGAEIKGSENLFELGTVKHTCYECLDGDIAAKWSLTFDAQLLNSENLKFEYKVHDNTYKIADFYYSVDKNKFGWGECPYMKYCVNVRAIDENGNRVDGASINNGDIYIGNTDSNGNLDVWLPNGDYYLTAEKNNVKASRKFTVFNNAKSIVINCPAEINANLYSGKKIILNSFNGAAVTEDGQLYTWGYNEDSQLGDGTTTGSATPKKIMDNVKSVNIEGTYGTLLTEDGSLYTWGGCNEHGQLGNGTITKNLIPQKIMDNVKYVSIKSSFGAAITEDNSLYMWGWNKYGQLGNGTKENSLVPIKIMDNVISVSIGNRCSAAIKEDGSLYMWGSNDYGQLGNGTTQYGSTPKKIMDNVKSISLNLYFTAVIAEDDILYIWGRNDYGQLGNGTTKDSSVPVKVMDNIKSVSSTHSYVAAIKKDGSLYTWGSNFRGQLGNGTTKDTLIPTKIMDNVKTVSLGTDDIAIIKEDNSVYMCGSNAYGQLGNGTTTGSYVPVKVEIPPSNSNTAALNLNQEYAIMADEPDTDTKYKAVPIFIHSDLIPNETYNFYVMKSKTAENPLSSDNLLYIKQAVSDNEGKLNISYITKKQYDSAVMFVKAASKTDISSAHVIIPDILCDGTERFAEPEVILNGKTLTEGIDYDIEKYYSAIYPGEYELIITGIRNYTGEIKEIYNVYCEHSFINSKCKFCKSLKDSVGDANGDGVVGVADLVALQNFLLTKRKDISINADINHDKIIDIFDLCLLRKIISQLIV